MTSMTLPALIQRFFTDRLCVQMEASHHTIASYRDTFRLLLRYAGSRLGKRPVAITVEDIDVDLVADFLVHTETARGNCARSRNTRLAAIRSFFRYVAMADPTWMLNCQRILAMPNKRYVKRAVTFLTADEIAALLAVPDRSTWAGKRDHALLLLALQKGIRADQLAIPGCCARHRRPRPMRRKGTKRTVHTDQAGNRQDPEGMDWGAWQQRSTTVPVDPWRTAKPRCARTFGTQALPGGSAHLSEHRRKAGHAAYLAPQHRDGLAPPWCRSGRDRTVAGS